MSADLDALLTHVYVLLDDLLPRRRRLGRPPRISDSELICLAVAQVLLDCPNERRFLRLAKRRLGHLFPYIPGQSGFNKAAAGAGAAVAGGDHAAGAALTLVLRPAAVARLDAGAVCGLARDRTPLRAGRDRRLRLLPLAQPLVLGLPALPALLAGRAADRLRARSGQRTRTRRRHRTARACPPTWPDRRLRQRLRRRRVRAARPLAWRHHPPSRPQGRTATLRLTRQRPPTDRVDLRHPQRPALARTPRRPHPHRPRHPHRPPTTRPQRRHPPQLADRQTRPQAHSLRPLSSESIV